MKNYIAFLIFSLLFTAGLAAQAVIPVAVESSFQNAYPTVEQPFWEMREGAFTAMFTHNEQLIKVFYERNGQLRETRVRTTLDALPTPVQTYISNHFEGADITYIGLVNKPNQSPLYRVESEVESAVHIKLFDETGSLLHQERIAYSTE